MTDAAARVSRLEPEWLEWSRRIAAIAQNGLTFARDPYDIERYTQLREVASEMLARVGGIDLAVVQGILAREQGYATPKVDMRGVVFRDHKVLMVRERTDQRWSLPGGWADPGESPAQNVVREIREESGFVARATKVLAIYDRSKHRHSPPYAFHVYKMFVACTILGGAAQPSLETEAVEFFGEHEIPELSVGRVTAQQIARMFEHHRDPDLPTDFDP